MKAGQSMESGLRFCVTLAGGGGVSTVGTLPCGHRASYVHSPVLPQSPWILRLNHLRPVCFYSAQRSTSQPSNADGSCCPRHQDQPTHATARPVSFLSVSCSMDTRTGGDLIAFPFNLNTSLLSTSLAVWIQDDRITHLVGAVRGAKSLLLFISSVKNYKGLGA